VILRQRRWLAVLLSIFALAACAGVNPSLPSSQFLSDMSLPDPLLSGPSRAPVSGQPAEARRADAHLQLALAYYQQAQWQTALDEVALALQAEPRLADGYSMRGLIFMASGRAAMAGADFRQALTLAPGQADYLNNYGWFLCRQGHAEASLVWFQRAAAQPAYRSPAKALINAGVCSVTAGAPAAAKSYFLKAAAQEPGNVQVHTELAKIYLNDGDLARAGSHARYATAGTKPDADALWLAIKVAHKSEQAATETKLLAQLHRLYPDSAEYAAYKRGVFDE
jgi:type IV pilus assembly protein PilF